MGTSTKRNKQAGEKLQAAMDFRSLSAEELAKEWRSKQLEGELHYPNAGTIRTWIDNGISATTRVLKSKTFQYLDEYFGLPPGTFADPSIFSGDIGNLLGQGKAESVSSPKEGVALFPDCLHLPDSELDILDIEILGQYFTYTIWPVLNGASKTPKKYKSYLKITRSRNGSKTLFAELLAKSGKSFLSYQGSFLSFSGHYYLFLMSPIKKDLVRKIIFLIFEKNQWTRDNVKVGLCCAHGTTTGPVSLNAPVATKYILERITTSMSEEEIRNSLGAKEDSEISTDILPLMTNEIDKIFSLLCAIPPDV